MVVKVAVVTDTVIPVLLMPPDTGIRVRVTNHQFVMCSRCIGSGTNYFTGIHFRIRVTSLLFLRRRVLAYTSPFGRGALIANTLHM